VKIRSTGWPVSSAMSPSTVSRVCRRSSACTSTSTADPLIPAEPWCIRTRAWGRAKRLPGVPGDSRNCPALHASPKASVATSQGTSRITSRMASIEGTDPPGEWIHNAMSFLGFSLARASSCVASTMPLSSSSTPSRTSTRWLKNRSRSRWSNIGCFSSFVMLRRCRRRGPVRRAICSERISCEQDGTDLFVVDGGSTASLVTLARAEIGRVQQFADRRVRVPGLITASQPARGRHLRADRQRHQHRNSLPSPP
jgi:hypothetical protein